MDNYKMKRNVERYVKRKTKYAELLASDNMKFLDDNKDSDHPLLKSNIIIQNFVYLLDKYKMNRKKYHQEIQVLNLCFLYIFYVITSTNKTQYESHLQKLFNLIEQIESQISKNHIEHDFEKELIKQVDHKLYNFELNTFPLMNKVYTLIANIFAATFKEHDGFAHYSYSYVLTMFTVLHIINSYKEKKESFLFVLELSANKKYIKLAKQIDSERFNLFIIKNNIWINKIQGFDRREKWNKN